MHTKLRTEAKRIFEKNFFKLMNNTIFGKIMENVRQHKNIKLVTTNKRINYLVSETNYHTKKYFFRKFISNRNEKNKIKNEQASISRFIDGRN